MEMKCIEIEERMIDYLDNRLDENDKKEVENHISRCERCLDEMRDIQEIFRNIDNEPMEEPDESLRINFYHMLHGEMAKSRKEKSLKPASSYWYNRASYRLAAGIALLVCGTFMGLMVSMMVRNTGNEKELSQLTSEVSSLKKAAFFSMLRDESSSFRLQAVSYADELKSPDMSVIDILVKTLNTDKNVNVRMAAAYALSKYSDQRQVSDSLIHSLSLQTDPIVQVTLINILVEKQEKNAVNAIRRIIDDKNTLPEVKKVAENGAMSLI